MTAPPVLSIAKERVSSMVYPTSLYFISIGVLYLWGYWPTFGVNILEHLPLTDVLKITAYPVATALLLSAVGATLGEALVSDERLPPGGGRDSRLGVFLRRFGPQLLGVYVLGTVALLFYGPIEKWRALPVLLGLPLYVSAKQAGFLKALIPHESPRSIVLYVLATLPPLAYGHGLLAANKITEGSAFRYLLSDFPKQAMQIDPLKALRYIGTAGELIFFFDPIRNAVVQAKIDANSPLVLKQFDRPTATDTLNSPALSKPASSASLPAAASSAVVATELQR